MIGLGKKVLRWVDIGGGGLDYAEYGLNHRHRPRTNEDDVGSVLGATSEG